MARTTSIPLHPDETSTMWQSYTLPRGDHDMACFVLDPDPPAPGPPLVMLNGGPGDDHRYLLPVAERLGHGRRCVLYDQRGCGASRLARLDDTTLHIDRFVEDLDALRQTLGVDRIDLLGHSWGAMLALIYTMTHPAGVARQILVGMGPLDPELADVAQANLLQPLSDDERADLADLKAARRAALAAGDLAAQAALHIRQMRAYSSRAWFYDRAAAARFAEDWAALYNFNPLVTPHLWPTVQAIDILAGIDGLAVPTLAIYGQQDFEPITQGYLLRERMPNVDIHLINRCGHVPWREQPERFYAAVEAYLEQ